MTCRVAFAYGQARIQAHYSRLLSAAEWGRLERVADYGQFVRVAQATALRPWLANLGPDSGAHQIELALRHVLRCHVRQVADWLPPAWRPAVRWFAVLADLPAAAHFRSGKPSAAWMRSDPLYAPLAALAPGNRPASTGDSILDPLVHADLPVAQAWARHWRSLWPSPSRTVTAVLERLVGALARDAPDAGGSAWLAKTFRQEFQRPGAVFAYLELMRRQADRLRGALMHRRLLGRGG